MTTVYLISPLCLCTFSISLSAPGTRWPRRAWHSLCSGTTSPLALSPSSHSCFSLSASTGWPRTGWTLWVMREKQLPDLTQYTVSVCSTLLGRKETWDKGWDRWCEMNVCSTLPYNRHCYSILFKHVNNAYFLFLSDGTESEHILDISLQSIM